MPTSTDSDFLLDAYTSRFGEGGTKQEAHGYWMFTAGVLLGLAGLFVLAYSTMTEPRSAAAFSRRQIAAVLGGAGLPLMMLGIVYRLPIKKTADRVALVGTAVCFVALAAFVVYYPSNWNVPSGSGAADQASVVTGLYGLGLVIIGIAALVMPSMIGRDEELERREDEVFEREGLASGREEEVERRETEVSEREELATGREEELSRRKKEIDTREDEVSEREAAVAAAAVPEESKAKFTLYKDKGGEWRWNLRHTNGNIIADSAEGYSSKQKAKQGLESVRKNAHGAPTTEADSENGEPAAADIDEKREAEYDLYEDNAGQWRWRLMAPNGLIIADSGQGYDDRRDAEAGIGTLRGKAPDADHLDITPAGFEVYRDEADEWRWRLIRQNGRIIADSGEGYTERSSAMEAVERVQEVRGETEIYENAGGDWSWRHVASNGEIVADGSEGYSTEDAAEEAVENFEKIAPEADTVEKGEAYFTVYKDAAEEWRWRFVTENGNIVADSGEGYTERNDAVEALERVKDYSAAPEA